MSFFFPWWVWLYYSMDLQLSSLFILLILFMYLFIGLSGSHTTIRSFFQVLVSALVTFFFSVLLGFLNFILQVLQVNHTFSHQSFPHYLWKKEKELHFMPCHCWYKLKKKEKARSCTIILNVEYKHRLFCLWMAGTLHDPDIVSLSMLSLWKLLQVITSYSFISYNPQF